MEIKKIIWLLKSLNIILNFIFGISIFKIDFIDYFSTVNEFKIQKNIEIEDSPLAKQDKAQLKILSVFVGSFFIVIGIVIFLIKIGEDGSNASDIINTATSNIKNVGGNISSSHTSKPMGSVDDVD